MQYHQPISQPKQRVHTRWYDRTPGLGHAILMLEALPEHFQVVMARQISESLRQEGRKKIIPGQLRQLGPEKILGLMKSKAKKRWHDQQPDLHKAFNDIFLTNEQDCQETSLRIMVSIQVIQQALGSGRTTLECERLVTAIFQANRTTLLENGRKLILPATGIPQDKLMLPSARNPLPATVRQLGNTTPEKQNLAISAAADKLLPHQGRNGH